MTIPGYPETLPANTLVGRLGIGSGPSQAIPISQVAARALYINVKDATYGALGNDAADDTAAIQRAINAAGAAGGGTVFFPAGKYRHTGLLITNDCVTLLGATQPVFDGANGTGAQLRYMVATGDHLTINNCSRAAVINMGFVGGVAALSGAAIHTNNSGQTSWHRFENIWIQSCWNGVLLQNTSAVELSFVDVHPNIGAEFGIKWTGASDVLYLNRCSIRPDTASNTVVGYFIGNGTNTTIGAFSGADLCKIGWQFDAEGGTAPIIVALYNCVAEDNNSHGIWMRNVASVEWTDGYVNINNGRGIFIDDGASNIRINGGQINLNDLEGIYMADGSKEVHVADIAIQDNGQAGAASHANVFIEANTTNFSFVGGRLGGDAILPGTSSTNATWGIQIAAGTSNWYRVVGVDTHGNATGGVQDGGTGVNKILASNI